jgi:hypothetical protein
MNAFCAILTTVVAITVYLAFMTAITSAQSDKTSELWIINITKQCGESSLASKFNNNMAKKISLFFAALGGYLGLLFLAASDVDLLNESGRGFSVPASLV